MDEIEAARKAFTDEAEKFKFPDWAIETAHNIKRFGFSEKEIALAIVRVHNNAIDMAARRSKAMWFKGEDGVERFISELKEPKNVD